MPAYATVAEFEDYVEGWVTDDADALARLLERASRDIDSVLGPLPILTDGDYAGFKVDPTEWADWEAAALARATSAQAHYRWAATEAGRDANAPAAKRIKGPVFEVEYDTENAGTGRLSPALKAELAPIAHRRGLVARAKA